MIRRRTVTTAATIVAATAALPAAASARSVPIDLKIVAHSTGGSGATFVQKGTFTGAPLTRGNVTVRTRVSGRRAQMRFEFRTSRGIVRGTGICTVTFSGTKITYRGTANLTSGTGSWRRFRARNLKVTGRGNVAGNRFDVRVRGRSS